MQPLRILHVEDDPHDRELASATLTADGVAHEIVYVDARPAFESALLSQSFDLILADYSLPGFDGLTAFGIARRCAPTTPFIFLSATLGEDLAVERLKEGATDYVLKQRVTRLPSAVRRAMREAAERAERERAEAEVRRLNAELEARVQQRTAELSASKELFQAIIDHSPIAIFVKDLEGRYLLINRGADVFFRRDAGEIIGQRATDVLPSRFAEIYAEHDRQVLAAGHAMQFEEPFAIGNLMGVVASTRFPLTSPDGTVRAVCSISEDITLRKEHEDELRLAKLEAQRANLAKNEFLSHMSHDLRTPLNAILGFAQLLELDELKSESADSVRQILHAGRHLLDLINGVLDITRIESGNLSLSPEPVLLHDVIEGAVNLIRPLVTRRGLTLDVQLPQCDEAAAADRQRLSQILINLLSNAVKYNRPGGRVDVRCMPGHAPGTIRVSVTDTGGGIPPDKLRLLFQPFERLGAERTAVEGTGLGLALSRSLAHAMGGELGVDSAVDHGSTFWIELPAAEAPVPRGADSSAQSTPVGAATGTVLYVEDNPANVRLMQRIVQSMAGVTLVHAATGADGLELAHAHPPGAVLLDLHLPDMQGDEILQRLWADPVTRAIPKIIVTADATPGLGRRLKAAGAAGFLTKPLDIHEVQRVLSDVLTGKEIVAE